MIGIFDSWFGGLQTLKYVQQLYPQYDYLFLADTAHVPYGDKDGHWIQQRLFAGLDWLFSHGATLVIIACNTAAAYGIRLWQATYPNKKALSITIPGVEKAVASGYHHFGTVATQATILSGIYGDLFERIGGPMDVMKLQCVFSPQLVPLIETGHIADATVRQSVAQTIKKFSPLPDCLILGCTHFPILMQYRKKYYPWLIIDPSWEAALSLAPYLDRHPDLKQTLTQHGTISYYVTGSVATFVQTWLHIWDRVQKPKKVSF